MVKSLDLWIAKYDRNARGAVATYTEAIAQVTVDPTAEAVKKRRDLEAKMAMPETWDKWQAGLERWDADSWKARTLKKGAPRYPAGIAEGIPKYKEFAEQFKPHLEEGQKAVKQMPKVSIEDSISRAEFMIRHNAKFRRR